MADAPGGGMGGGGGGQLVANSPARERSRMKEYMLTWGLPVPGLWFMDETESPMDVCPYLPADHQEFCWNFQAG